MVRWFLAGVFLFVTTVVPVSAGTASELARVLQIDALVDIMREEGMSEATVLGDQMIVGGASTGWLREVEKIYDVQRMSDSVETALSDLMSASEMEAAVAFFETDLGRQIISLETSARLAMADAEVEQAARDMYDEQRGAHDAKFKSIEQFVSVNDLLERNVAGTMSSTYQFYAGLAAGGALDMDEEMILADVWSQESDLRADTESWLFGYLMLAYQPLSTDDLGAYIAYSETADGQALNAALFDGFNAMYRAISYALGLTVAQAMSAQDL